VNSVHVACRGVTRPPWLRVVGRYCRAVLHELGTRGWELSVMIADDEVVRELNRSYRGIDKSTDVLSFSQTEGEAVPAAEGRGSLAAGDIVISLPTTERQAMAAGVPLDEELRRLLIHGILHLKGMDHHGKSDEMLRLQEQLMSRIGVRLF
jgi:probable rRNA maturation factor